jgi:hypothetical protein
MYGFRFVFAPLEITDSRTLVDEASFAGELFDPGVPTEANYKSSSFRLTYRYRFYDGPTWTRTIGATNFIRDARVALQQEEFYAEDTDVGFLPLV